MALTALLPSAEACETAVLLSWDWTGLACSQDLGCFDVCAQLHLTFCGPMDCGLPGSSVEFSRQEYWSGLPFPSLGDLPDPGIKSESLISPELAGGFFTTNVMWEHRIIEWEAGWTWRLDPEPTPGIARVS